MLLTTMQLRARGWTPAGITRFLKAPDSTKPNRYYRSAPPTKLYLSSRVEEIESTAEYQAWRTRAQHRSQAGRDAAARRAQALLVYVQHIEVKLPALTLDQVLDRAIQSYNNRRLDRALARGEEFRPAARDSAPHFLHRITVNFLRHELTRYDHTLQLIAGSPGCGDAYPALFQRIMAVISVQFPELAEECQRQLRARQPVVG